MVYTTWIASIYALVCILILLKVEGGFVNITYVESAVEKGAVCLDGSAPAYFLATGFDSGVNNWLVHIEGGGWCNNVESCLARKDTNLGSSNHMEQQHFFSAILSDDQSSNPYFYNWNRVFVRYCDGSSFTGDVEEVDPIRNILVPETADPNGSRNDCKQDLQKCSEYQLQTIQDFRNEFLSALGSLGYSPSIGMFINSCYSHSQAETPETWFGANSPVLENTPIAVAVGNWFYDQSSFQQIDCPYPCNPSCYKRSP